MAGLKFCAGYRCFNPRSRRGSDRQRSLKQAAMTSFNPRSRRGATSIRSVHIAFPTVSIHAPAGGATCVFAFISRSAMFQSTLPQGERLGPSPSENYRHQGFNPRSRRGSDLYISLRTFDISPFQSTLPQGERLTRSFISRASSRFNPRSRRGSDWPVVTASPAVPGFNPRSRRGSDLPRVWDWPHAEFQSTLPQGERLTSDL